MIAPKIAISTTSSSRSTTSQRRTTPFIHALLAQRRFRRGGAPVAFGAIAAIERDAEPAIEEQDREQHCAADKVVPVGWDSEKDERAVDRAQEEDPEHHARHAAGSPEQADAAENERGDGAELDPRARLVRHEADLRGKGDAGERGGETRKGEGEEFNQPHRQAEVAGRDPVVADRLHPLPAGAAVDEEHHGDRDERGNPPERGDAERSLCCQRLQAGWQVFDPLAAGCDQHEPAVEAKGAEGGHDRGHSEPRDECAVEGAGESSD